jgi:hypothetical protein
MSLVAVLDSILSMLLGGCGVFLALRVITLAVMLSCGAMRLSRVLMVFGSLVVFVFGHRCSPIGLRTGNKNGAALRLFPHLIDPIRRLLRDRLLTVPFAVPAAAVGWLVMPKIASRMMIGIEMPSSQNSTLYQSPFYAPLFPSRWKCIPPPKGSVRGSFEVL